MIIIHSLFPGQMIQHDRQKHVLVIRSTIFDSLKISKEKLEPFDEFQFKKSYSDKIINRGYNYDYILSEVISSISYAFCEIIEKSEEHIEKIFLIPNGEHDYKFIFELGILFDSWKIFLGEKKFKKYKSVFEIVTIDLPNFMNDYCYSELNLRNKKIEKKAIPSIFLKDSKTQLLSLVFSLEGLRTYHYNCFFPEKPEKDSIQYEIFRIRDNYEKLIDVDFLVKNCTLPSKIILGRDRNYVINDTFEKKIENYSICDLLLSRNLFPKAFIKTRKKNIELDYSRIYCREWKTPPGNLRLNLRVDLAKGLNVRFFNKETKWNTKKIDVLDFKYIFINETDFWDNFFWINGTEQRNFFLLKESFSYVVSQLILENFKEFISLFPKQEITIPINEIIELSKKRFSIKSEEFLKKSSKEKTTAILSYIHLKEEELVNLSQEKKHKFNPETELYPISSESKWAKRYSEKELEEGGWYLCDQSRYDFEANKEELERLEALLIKKFYNSEKPVKNTEFKEIILKLLENYEIRQDLFLEEIKIEKIIRERLPQIIHTEPLLVLKSAKYWAKEIVGRGIKKFLIDNIEDEDSQIVFKVANEFLVERVNAVWGRIEIGHGEAGWHDFIEDTQDREEINFRTRVILLKVLLSLLGSNNKKLKIEELKKLKKLHLANRHASIAGELERNRLEKADDLDEKTQVSNQRYSELENEPSSFKKSQEQSEIDSQERIEGITSWEENEKIINNELMWITYFLIVLLLWTYLLVEDKIRPRFKKKNKLILKFKKVLKILITFIIAVWAFDICFKTEIITGFAKKMKLVNDEEGGIKNTNEANEIKNKDKSGDDSGICDDDSIDEVNSEHTVKEGLEGDKAIQKEQEIESAKRLDDTKKKWDEKHDTKTIGENNDTTSEIHNKKGQRNEKPEEENVFVEKDIERQTYNSDDEIITEESKQKSEIVEKLKIRLQKFKEAFDAESPNRAILDFYSLDEEFSILMLDEKFLEKEVEKTENKCKIKECYLQSQERSRFCFKHTNAFLEIIGK